MSWEKKVDRVIAALAQQAYREANYARRGRKKAKRHRPYRLPEEADRLVKCLGDRDRKRGERTCKEIMEGLRRRGAKID